ncbi:hypothetical protein Tco_0369015 [Tanacetum coccineum]
MAVLDSCPKHNMVAYLEKSEGNAEFHEIIDFLKRSSIHHALTISPVVSTTFVEQFWTSAKSKIINNVRHITAKVAGKSVSISEASIRSDLLFDDADGIDSLPNQAIFDAIQLMGVHKESVSKQGRKFAKGKPSVQRDPLFDELPEDTDDHMETENAQDEGRTREVVDEDKEIEENVLSTKDVLSTNKEKVSTDKPIVSTDASKVSTDRHIEGTDEKVEGTEEHNEGTKEQTKSTEGKEKLKILKNRTDLDLPLKVTSPLKPLPKLDPKYKGKKKIEEERMNLKENLIGIPKAEKTFKQLESDEELARKKVARRVGSTQEESKEEVRRRVKTKSTSKEEDLTDQAEQVEEINQNVVIRSNGQKRYFSTLMRVLSIFDREDLNVVYQLVMDRFQDEIPEGFDIVLWGDLMVMFNPDDENEFWNSQLDWIIVSWKLHSSSKVHTLVTETGLVIHMLVEKKYPLRKEVLMQMLKLKLESEEDSTMALELIRFIKKMLAELEP